MGTQGKNKIHLLTLKRKKSSEKNRTLQPVGCIMCANTKAAAGSTSRKVNQIKMIQALEAQEQEPIASKHNRECLMYHVHPC